MVGCFDNNGIRCLVLDDVMSSGVFVFSLESNNFYIIIYRLLVLGQCVDK